VQSNYKDGNFEHLRLGERYVVTRAFVDETSREHPVGETFWFRGYSYVAYYDGLTLYVSFDGTTEASIRFLDRPDAQGPIVRDLATYIAPLA
jgi:hypothetical protein